MSTPAQQPSYVLVRRTADGAIEWIPLEGAPQRIPVLPDASYTLIDRAVYEAPGTLQAERVGDDLVVEAGGNDVLVLEGFYSQPGVSFYPTTDIAAGAGPFSGPTITATSPASAAGDQMGWTASGAETAASTASAGGGGGAALGWVGAGAGLLGVAALAGGGGGSGGGESGGGGNPPPSDTTPPQITSGSTATAVEENSGAGQVVYTATATDTGAITYELSGEDAAAFTINSSTGAVTLTGNPDFEAKSSYSFTVIARDAAGNSASAGPFTINLR